MQLEISTLLTVATVIFSAGIVYQKVNTVEKKVTEHDKWGERIAANETDIENLKNKFE